MFRRGARDNTYREYVLREGECLCNASLLAARARTGSFENKHKDTMSSSDQGAEVVSLLADEANGLPKPQDVTHNLNRAEKTRLRWKRAVKVACAALGITFAFLLGRLTRDVFPPTAEGRRQETASTAMAKPVLKSPRLTPLGPACAHDSWQRAKAQGCVYDLMLSSWVQPECYNGDMYAQYREWMEWREVRFWREPEMVREVSYEVAESGEHGFLWAQGLQHHLHCSYVMDRNRYAEERTPKVLDAYSRNKSHVDHCLFLNAVPFGWEIASPNVTRIYQPYDNECLVDSA